MAATAGEFAAPAAGPASTLTRATPDAPVLAAGGIVTTPLASGLKLVRMMAGAAAAGSPAPGMTIAPLALAARPKVSVSRDADARPSDCAVAAASDAADALRCAGV
ncbi:hypothetical protein OKW50_003074 [Paraburkholderia youngii]